MVFFVVTLIGRKNVGKSTLFNRLTRTSDALVGSDNLGLTRDRRYGSLKYKDCEFIIVDTGGMEISREGISSFVFEQSMHAISEANLILFVVDGQIGLVSGDYDIIHYLYKSKKSVFVVVNKIDHCNLEYSKFDFFSLGMKKIIYISAAHGYGINVLLDEIFLNFYKKNLFLGNKFCDESEKSKKFLKNPSSFLKGKGSEIIKVAVVGSPNVGKSTFINYVLGEKRMVVSPVPGTTHDSICVSMVYDNYKWILIDTAGMRKKNRACSRSEEISIINTLQILENVTVVLLLINASCCGISSYDLSLLNSILRSGKSLVLGVNKWDLLSNSLQKKFKRMCNVRMHFIPFINKKFISSLSGYGIPSLLKSIIKVHCSSFKFISTSSLTRIMCLAVDRYFPSVCRKKKVKLKYAHLGGRVPFIIVIHGNHVIELSDTYKRYLSNYFSRALSISGVSIFLRFKEDS